MRLGLRCFIAALIGCALVFAVSSCSEVDVADPGNRRLKALEEDSAFGMEIPGATLTSTESSPARAGGLFSDYNIGPAVFSNYRLSIEVEEVFEHLRGELPHLGWEYVRTAPDGTDVFEKDFGSWNATLSVHYNARSDSLDVNLSGPPETPKS